MTDSPLFSAVARFLRHLGVERQLSPITLLNYQRQLDALIALADEAGLKSWSQCDAAQVRSFAVRSRRAGLGPASLALRLSALAGRPGRAQRQSGEGDCRAENSPPPAKKY